MKRKVRVRLTRICSFLLYVLCGELVIRLRYDMQKSKIEYFRFEGIQGIHTRTRSEVI